MVKPLDTHVKLTDTKAFADFKDMKLKADDIVKFAGKGLDVSTLQMKTGHTTIIGKIKHFFQGMVASKNPDLRQQIRTYNDSVKEAFIDKIKKGAGESMRASLEKLMNQHEEGHKSNLFEEHPFSFFTAIGKREFINQIVSKVEKFAVEVATQELDRKMGATGENRGSMTGSMVNGIMRKVEDAIVRIEANYDTSKSNTSTYYDEKKRNTDKDYVPNLLNSVPLFFDANIDPRFRMIMQFDVNAMLRENYTVPMLFNSDYFAVDK